MQAHSGPYKRASRAIRIDRTRKGWKITSWPVFVPTYREAQRIAGMLRERHAFESFTRYH